VVAADAGPSDTRLGSEIQEWGQGSSGLTAAAVLTTPVL
jgi:hypothetical protein